MMLARVAGSLYWIGRYLERAENVARLLMVTSEVTAEFEGIDEDVAQAEWDALLAALPGGTEVALEYSPASRLSVPYVEALLLDDGNPVSVRHSLAQARENARAIREALTREVFLGLNTAFHELEAQRRKGVRDPAAALEAVTRTHQALLATLGAMENTLSRDQGWIFLKLGEAIERTLRTVAVLGTRLPLLAEPAEAAQLPLLYARWRSLLRCLASLENYRRAHGAGLDPARVVRFLLLDPATPRSMRCGLARIRGYLDGLPGGRATSPADRIVGRLLASLDYDDEQILGGPGPGPFLGQSAGALMRAHEAIAKQYFDA